MGLGCDSVDLFVACVVEQQPVSGRIRVRWGGRCARGFHTTQGALSPLSHLFVRRSVFGEFASGPGFHVFAFSASGFDGIRAQRWCADCVCAGALLNTCQY